ncbi:MAG: LysR family transcriptional regulator [Rhodoplanes sp.]
MSSPFDMRAFVRVVERGSFSAAGKDLGLTPSAVSKLVSRLEDRLGTRLLHRTTRRLALTPEGEIYELRARDILSAIEDAEMEVTRAGTTPRGRLRINMGTAFMLHALARALPDFLARYPDIEVELSVTDRHVDLLAENCDVAIRTGPFDDPSLIARTIARTERHVFGSPDYLARRGTPKTPDDLAHHDCIRLSSMPALNRWPFAGPDGPRVIEISGRIAVDDAEAALRLAIAGAGLIRVADLLAGNAARRGELVPLLMDYHFVEPVPVSAAYPAGRHRMAKVRAFIDFLVERFSGQPWSQLEAMADDHFASASTAD